MKEYFSGLKDLNSQIPGIYGGYLRLLITRRKDLRTSGCHLARGVWPGLGRVSPDVTKLLTISSYFLQSLHPLLLSKNITTQLYSTNCTSSLFHIVFLATHMPTSTQYSTHVLSPNSSSHFTPFALYRNESLQFLTLLIL